MPFMGIPMLNFADEYQFIGDKKTEKLWGMIMDKIITKGEGNESQNKMKLMLDKYHEKEKAE
jgi:hypothetical protein